jgi:hypothetical protein
MPKALRSAILLISLSLVCSYAYCAVFPSVSFSFDSASYEYSWTVSCPEGSSYPFGQFTVDAMVPAVWTGKSGPWVGESNLGWDFVTSAPRPDGNVSFWWRATTEQEVLAGAAWSGVFKLVAPGTTPVLGTVQTKDGAILSRHNVSTYVPGAVPEPSGMAALGTLVAGFVPFLRKRRK